MRGGSVRGVDSQPSRMSRANDQAGHFVPMHLTVGALLDLALGRHLLEISCTVTNDFRATPEAAFTSTLAAPRVEHWRQFGRRPP
jgi:hypothetical protein